MSINVLSKVLPYALMAFVGVAGWAMESVPLLAIVVLGTMGIAIGTTIAAKEEQREEAAALDLTTVDHDQHHDQHHEGHTPHG